MNETDKDIDKTETTKPSTDVELVAVLGGTHLIGTKMYKFKAGETVTVRKSHAKSMAKLFAFTKGE